MTAAAKIAEYMRQNPEPVNVAEIATALKIKLATVKAALCKMTERGQAVHVGRHNATRYTMAQPKPPTPPGPTACTVSAVCNGSMREPLVYSSMHSDRPGAMDYQSIPSLVGGQRVPYRAGVVR